jgi:hypothetical protein
MNKVVVRNFFNMYQSSIFIIVGTCPARMLANVGQNC